MLKKCLHAVLLAISILLQSCETCEYFHDPVSRERQKELVKYRSGHVFSDIGLSFASLFTYAGFDLDIGFIPQSQDFRKLKIINPTKDTLYVNMLTDIFWDEQNYCDFLDIRIPSKEKCKFLVPVDANYNLYFSTTPEQDDDEFIEINTNNYRKLSLYPELTISEEDKAKAVNEEFNDLD